MFKRRLKALGYLEWEKANVKDPQHFRKLVVWLEDQKIRQYKIEDRKQLRDIKNENWPKVFEKYCTDANCPISNKIFDQLEWLLGHAIWLEAGDESEGYPQKIIEKRMKSRKEALVPKVNAANPLDNLDFGSKEFINGTYSLAKLLQVPQNPDHLITLKACSKLVQKRLNDQNLRNANSNTVQGKPFPVMSIAPGFHLTDPKLENAAKGLTLLYIQDIRELQTKINEAIVGIQRITANPKTDTKIGKVGK